MLKLIMLDFINYNFIFRIISLNLSKIDLYFISYQSSFMKQVILMIIFYVIVYKLKLIVFNQMLKY